MRTLLAAALLLGLTACSRAQEKKADAEPAKPKLGLGDAAPPLQVSKWMRGDEVRDFAPGKVYVVDFWATWCGPCIASMPHLSDLTEEYKDKGLTAVAVTTKDPNNSAEAAEEFVKTKGSKFGFAFAFCDTDATYDAYMTAAGQNGIPCSFVVDKGGKIAYIGHPLELVDVLPKVIDGTWRGQADIDAIAAANEEFGKIFEKAEKDPAGGLRDLDAFGEKYPTRTKQDQFRLSRVALLLQSKQADAAKEATAPLLTKFAAKKNARGLNSLRAVWTSKDFNGERKHLDVAIAAAEALMAAEGAGPQSLIFSAQTYAAAGDKAKAAELADRAVAAAGPNEKLKAQLEKMAAEIKK